jgi:hypothetical protein
METRDGPALFGQFESLGANCEFGFVLRKAGVETPSLLRWSMITALPALLTALEQTFAGLYAFERLVPYNAGMVLDTRYRIAFHSALHSSPVAGRPGVFAFDDGEEDRRDIHRFEAAKVAEQVEQFRLGLATGERMLVFRKFQGALSPQEIAGLFMALRQHGPVRLLVVSLATAERPAGSVIAHAPGLLHGAIDRFAPGDRADQVSFAMWTAICQRALEMAPPE